MKKGGKPAAGLASLTFVCFCQPSSLLIDVQA
jgi:hypothetical protein